MSLSCQQAMQAWAHAETLLSQCDGRDKQRSPWQFAVLAVGQLEHAQRAGRAHRTPTHNSLVKGQRLTAGV